MKKFSLAVVMVIAALIAGAPPVSAASPWAQNPTYGSKVKGKFNYGLKNTLLGWTAMFIEPYQPKYGKRWEGFCVGAAQSVFYTASGLIQLVTFPIPADFPDIGPGIHIPEAEKKYSYKTKPAAVQPAAPTEAAAPASATERVPAPAPAVEPAAAAPSPGDSEEEAAMKAALEAAAANTMVGPDNPPATADEEAPAQNENVT